jgi:glycosyltransferase involved in cell wall biosynthesis
MRIAYVCPYQGPTLLSRRPIVRNRSMASRVKIELLARVLCRASHDVEIIAPGEVIETSGRFYPGFSEPERFDDAIPVSYASAFPVRRVNGFWSLSRTLQLFKKRHNARPFDLLLIYNLKDPQVACASYALSKLEAPVVLEYEDDQFVTVEGEAHSGFVATRQMQKAERVLQAVSGCIGVSPHLLSQAPADIPKLLLRGAVGADVISASRDWRGKKTNIVLFSGTHIESNGVAQLIEGWRLARPADWELHITGYGGLTETLRQMTVNVPGILFHGLVERPELIRLMCSAKICINPHQLSQTPGNVFAFKIVEYLAAGAHVLTTPMGELEPEISAGITYLRDNAPATIAAALGEVIGNRRYEMNAMDAAQHKYGMSAVSSALESFLGEVQSRNARRIQ